MSKNDHEVCFCPCLGKLFMQLKITILFCMLSIPSVFATHTYDLFTTGIEGNTSITELQQKVITGTITDNATGQTMPGVNVLIKGSTVGVLSDANGRYSIPVTNLNAILVFSFIGYETQEITVAGQSVINIKMAESIEALEEVVVIGYGTAKRADLTGSVGSMSVNEIQNVSVTNVEQAMLGKLAGVQVKNVSGEPGIGTQIRIRGIGSISASVNPLYVVDGFPTDDISTINPNDIENIDILKDASATAIYGSRGANGVIFITTKRGSTGKAAYSFDYYYGWQKVLLLRETMNAREQAQYYYDGIRNRNLDNGNDVSGPPDKWKIIVPKTPLDVLSGVNTIDRDMFADVLQTAPMSQYQLSASGGTENIKYSLSGEYARQDGIVIDQIIKDILSGPTLMPNCPESYQ